MQPVPPINVNLAKCERHHLPLHRDESQYHVLPGTGNLALCEAPPVLIPCHIPRSVTFTVVLGECNCPANGGKGAATWLPPPECLASCPGRPIRVSCSISGKTWDESEVTLAEVREPVSGEAAQAPFAALNAARERWALVKALVLGKRGVDGFTPPPQCFDMMVQRDVVYAKLATLARTEQAYATAYSEAWEAIGQHKSSNMEGLTSTTILGEYVERLVELVGVLP